MKNAKHRSSGSVTSIALLTGANDPPYVLPLTRALVGRGVRIDFIGNDEMADTDIARNERVNYLNFRGSQDESAAFSEKAVRILRYYLRLIYYTWQTEKQVFHILWLNKFTFFDRTFLNFYYKILGKKLVFTAHNVNEGKRDGTDGVLNRISLYVMYRLMDYIFVHTNRGKSELMEDFKIGADKVRVIPFGMNDTAPQTQLTSGEAKRLLGLSFQEKVLLFFGQIAPYKGLEYLVEALPLICKKKEVRLIIAGKIKKGYHKYWRTIEGLIARNGIEQQIIKKIEFIPDDEIEIYFKAADALVLPYVDIFQSGVLVLSYYFGLPVIGTDVGELSEDIIDGKTGFLCRPRDPENLSGKILRYFDAPLYQNLADQRKVIREYAKNKYSWEIVGTRLLEAYNRLLQGTG